MSLPPDFVEILRCPRSGEPVIHVAAVGETPPFLFCPASRLAYRIDDGVPVLLVEEAREVDAEEAAGLVPDLA